MKHNVGNLDRILRALAGLVMLACSVIAPLPLIVRVAGFGVVGGYLLLSALVSSCACYALMGKSTCATKASR